MVVREPQSLLQLAEDRFAQQQYAEAREPLEQLLSDLPHKWRSSVQTPSLSWEIAFWDEAELKAFLPFAEEKFPHQPIKAVYPSYSKACYLLARIAHVEGKAEEAMKYLDWSLNMEPDHPAILTQKASWLQLEQDHQQAYQYYVKAIHARSWMKSPHQATAMRGAGELLFHGGKYAASSIMFKKSLELEPANRLARKRLAEILDIRREQKKALTPQPQPPKPAAKTTAKPRWWERYQPNKK